MKIVTTRFGEIEVAEDKVYTFPEGILGFSDVKAYCILDNPKGGPFQWLQAVKLPPLAFVVCDPRIFLPKYKVRVKKEELASIKLDDVSDGIVLIIITVPADPQEMTANLRGPLIFNTAEHLAKQVVLPDPEYITKYKIFKREEVS